MIMLFHSPATGLLHTPTPGMRVAYYNLCASADDMFEGWDRHTGTIVERIADGRWAVLIDSYKYEIYLWSCDMEPE